MKLNYQFTWWLKYFPLLNAFFDFALKIIFLGILGILQSARWRVINSVQNNFRHTVINNFTRFDQEIKLNLSRNLYKIFPFQIPINNSSSSQERGNWWHQSNATAAAKSGHNNLSPSAADDGRSYFRDYENIQAAAVAGMYRVVQQDFIVKNKVARWRHLIPSFPWIAPGWRVWGRNPRKGRDQILQRSGAEP